MQQQYFITDDHHEGINSNSTGWFTWALLHLFKADSGTCPLIECVIGSIWKASHYWGKALLSDKANSPFTVSVYFVKVLPLPLDHQFHLEAVSSILTLEVQAEASKRCCSPALRFCLWSDCFLGACRCYPSVAATFCGDFTQRLKQKDAPKLHLKSVIHTSVKKTFYILILIYPGSAQNIIKKIIDVQTTFYLTNNSVFIQIVFGSDGFLKINCNIFFIGWVICYD